MRLTFAEVSINRNSLRRDPRLGWRMGYGKKTDFLSAPFVFINWNPNRVGIE